MDPDLQQPNPYAPPGISPRFRTPIYSWPLSKEKEISIDTDIDLNRLSVCVTADRGYTDGFQILTAIALVGTGYCLPLFAAMRVHITTIIAALFGCLLLLWYSIPRSRKSWHALRLSNRFAWLWGTVHVRLNHESILWQNSTIQLEVPWDGFQGITLSQDTLWFSTKQPFPIRLPIHQSWVSNTTWWELLTVCQAHAGFDDKEGYQSSSNNASFDGFEAPEIEAVPETAIPFRAIDADSVYHCEHGRLIAKRVQMGFALCAIISVGSHLILNMIQWDENPLAIWENVPFLIGFGGWLTMRTWNPWQQRWLLPGVGYLRCSQELLGSQAGYVSRDELCVATPAYTMISKIGLEGTANVQISNGCLVMKFPSHWRQFIVVPLDQFAEADIPRVVQTEFPIAGH